MSSFLKVDSEIRFESPCIGVKERSLKPTKNVHGLSRKLQLVKQKMSSRMLLFIALHIV